MNILCPLLWSFSLFFLWHQQTLPRYLKTLGILSSYSVYWVSLTFLTVSTSVLNLWLMWQTWGFVYLTIFFIIAFHLNDNVNGYKILSLNVFPLIHLELLLHLHVHPIKPLNSKMSRLFLFFLCSTEASPGKFNPWNLYPTDFFFRGGSRPAHEIQSLWAWNPLACILIDSETWLFHFDIVGKNY